MAVVISIARGHDASYTFRTIGAAANGKPAAGRGAGYYLSAVEKGGEPAGTWVGNGAAELGFRDGDVVLREDFEPLYGQFTDPRDPGGRTHLGSRRGSTPSWRPSTRPNWLLIRVRRRMSGCAC